MQPKLAARVRLLATGEVNKNDPNDARSVAIAALRSTACPPVRADDHAAVLKVWAKRHRDLSRSRNQVVCRLHAVLCELIPGGVSKQIHAAAAACILEQTSRPAPSRRPAMSWPRSSWPTCAASTPSGRDTKKKLAAAIRASGTTVTEVFGVGPAVAAAVIGDVRDISRFPGRDCFAAYNGTAPVEVSSGSRVIYRLSLRGNRRLNHAIHMAAVTQIRYRHTKGRAYYDKKIAEGKTPKEALRALKRQVSDAIYQRLKADARRGRTAGPGRPTGERLCRQRGRSHPEHRLFGQATPGPGPTLRPRPAAQHPALPAPGAELAIPRSLPPCRRRSRGSRWSARSEARTNDLDAPRDDGHTRLRGRPRATIRKPGHRASEGHLTYHEESQRSPLTQRGIRYGGNSQLACVPSEPHPNGIYAYHQPV